MYENLKLSAGRDYKYAPLVRYDFWLYDGENVVAHASGFKSKAAAIRAGQKAAEPLLAPALPNL